MNHGKIATRLQKLGKKLNYYSSLEDEQSKWVATNLKKEIERLKKIKDADSK